MAMLTRLTSSGASTAAVAPGSPKALQRFQNCVAFLWPSLNYRAGAHDISTQNDAIDCFTNELVERKSKKWGILRQTLLKRPKSETVVDGATSSTIVSNMKSTSTVNSLSKNIGLVSKAVMSDLKTLRCPELGLDIRSLSEAQLDNLLMSTLEIKNKVDFLYLINQCILWQQLPSQEVLVSCLKYLSSLSRVQQIESIAGICKKQNHPLHKLYAELAPFKAMALWRNGGTDLALATLQQGYKDSASTDDGKRMIRAAFRTISEETLAKKSEAVLVALMEVARSIYNNYGDIFVIACVWKQCFISDWFCDQKSAMEIFDEYKDLQQLVDKRSSPLCSSFLSRNNVDAVHRLVEVFLQYKFTDACSNCLRLLFDYQYYRNDLRACAEIIKSCNELEMPLSEMQNEQFLSLFINQSNEPFPVPLDPALVTPGKQFQYRF